VSDPEGRRVEVASATADGGVPDEPGRAGVPGTKGPTRVYENDDIRVAWDATRCIHAATCLRVLPEVFDVHARPWIDLSGAPAERVAGAVRMCPTGALRYESRGALPDEQPDEPTTIELRPGGPLYVRGRIRLIGPSGKTITEEARVALCRCGASRNKPFCDNTHRLLDRPLERGLP
jgi:uncharacterized Fe-S cluster protein YjdI